MLDKLQHGIIVRTWNTSQLESCGSGGLLWENVYVWRTLTWDNHLKLKHTRIILFRRSAMVECILVDEPRDRTTINSLSMPQL